MLRRIMAFVVGVIAFVILYVPVLFALNSITGFLIGLVGGFVQVVEPQQRQRALAELTANTQQFTAVIVPIIKVAAALLVAWIARRIAYKMVMEVAPKRKKPKVAREEHKAATTAVVPGGNFSIPQPAPFVPKQINPVVNQPTKPVPPPSPVASAPVVKLPRNPVKDKLFGNLPMDQWPSMWDEATGSPWAEFVAARGHLAAGETEQAVAIWQAIVASPGLESLHYLQAWHFLRENGVSPAEEETKQVYGVIGEQGASGVLIAAFLDGQARLYGDNGQAIVWTHPDDSLDPLIETVLGGAVALVHKMKQSDVRIESSRTSINSISVLTTSGVYTKCGAAGSFEATPLVKPIADGFGQMTKALMEKAKTVN